MASDGSTSKTAKGRERRQHARHSTPRLTIRIEDRKYRTYDWSLGGFRISGFHREIRSGENLVGNVDRLGGLFREPFEADVVRVTAEGDVCCRFLLLPKTVMRVATGM